MHFARPAWLWALALAPLALALFVLTARAKRSTFALGNPVLVGASHGVWAFQGLPWFLRLLTLSLCLVAAAQPQAGRRKVESKKPVSDLYVVLDVSPSMMADDLKPNRMTAAKNYLSEFVEKLEGVRVGLSVFGGRSFTQCPLTTDLRVLRYLLGAVDINSVQINGTAVGDGLASAVNRLKKGRATPQTPPEGKKREESATPHSQAILLITDGQTTVRESIDPLMAAMLAAREGITVYAIGVGTPEGVPAPYPMPDGTISYAMDEKGDIIRTFLDEKPLKQIAEITGGRYFRVTDNQSMSSVLNGIASMEKHEAVAVTRWEYRELAPAFLLGAFLLLAMDFLMGMTLLRTLP